MNLISYIFGFIGAVFMAALVVLGNQWLAWDIHSLRILHIIPVGGLLLGVGGTAGFFLAKRLSHAKMTKIDYFISIILAILTFFSVNYISYGTNYLIVDEDNNIKTISQFSQPKDESYVSWRQLMSFREYLNFINSSSTIHEVGRKKKITEIGEIETKILFYFQIIGVLLGSLVLALWWSKFYYCDNCKKYYKKDILKKFGMEHMEDLNQHIKNNLSLQETMDKIPEKDSQANQYGQIELHYCPDCYDANLTIKFFDVCSNGETQEIREMRQTISLDVGAQHRL